MWLPRRLLILSLASFVGMLAAAGCQSGSSGSPAPVRAGSGGAIGANPDAGARDVGTAVDGTGEIDTAGKPDLSLSADADPRDEASADANPSVEGDANVDANTDVSPYANADVRAGGPDTAVGSDTAADLSGGPDAPADTPVRTDTPSSGPPDGAGDAPLSADARAPGSIVTTLDVDTVWSGHPVGFALLTRGNQQFVAYYDAQRAMTIAQRTLDSSTWTFTRLASTLGWDSHNSIAMAIDSAGFIHIAGNMHAVPLVYFRSTKPLDVSTLQPINAMVGANETSCTYPQFINGPGGEFVFAYRDGVSGNGNYVFNVYDVPTKTWRRLINTPLTDGEGLRNAYPVGPTLGPDGWWHLVYVWRETPDASSNHDLSYAKSRDLVNWQTGTGKALTLPITLGTSDIVDPVPQNGGIINNNTKVGFDSQNRPVVGYHKYDPAGNTQLYNARVEGGRWVTHKTSNWTTRWTIGGGGTLIFQIQLDGVRVGPGGALTQVWYHAQNGGWSAFQLDETTLASVAILGRTLPYPAALERVESAAAGMGVKWASDSGAGPDPSITYMLRWETLPENQDQPRPIIPAATRLRLYGFGQ